MKKLILILISVCCVNSLMAQNLGEKFDWLKLSYTKIPLKASLPFYDTVFSYGNQFSIEKLQTNAKYYFETVLAAPSVDTVDKKLIGKGTYTIYTDYKKDEEHTYTVNYSMEIGIKDGKLEIAMHDFDIFYLTNKVEFPAKYKRAESNDGKSNYFMALFNDQNNVEIKKLAKVLMAGTLPETATVAN